MYDDDDDDNDDDASVVSVVCLFLHLSVSRTLNNLCKFSVNVDARSWEL